jgi:hypothetical protein
VGKAQGGALVPSSLGCVVAAFLAAYFPTYVDYGFTSGLEQQLDDVSAGRAQWQQVRRLAGGWARRSVGRQLLCSWYGWMPGKEVGECPRLHGWRQHPFLQAWGLLSRSCLLLSRPCPRLRCITAARGRAAAAPQVLGGFWGPFQQVAAGVGDVSVSQVRGAAAPGWPLGPAGEERPAMHLPASPNSAATHAPTGTAALALVPRRRCPTRPALGPVQVFDALDALLGPAHFRPREGGADPRACPQCGGRLVIKPARGQGAFIGCSNYSEGGCGYSRPLLQGDQGELELVPGAGGWLGVAAGQGVRARAARGRGGPLRVVPGRWAPAADARPPATLAPMLASAAPSPHRLQRLQACSQPQRPHASGATHLPRLAGPASAGGARHIGDDPATSRPVLAKLGPYGPYVQLGEDPAKGAAGGAEPAAPAPRRATLPKHLSPGAVTLQEALQLLALPRELGEHPALPGGFLVAAAGRFGPYVQWGGVSAALPKGLHPLDVSLEAAAELVLKKRERLLAKGRAPEDLAPKAAGAASAGGGSGGRKGRRGAAVKLAKGGQGARRPPASELAADAGPGDDQETRPLGRRGRRPPKAQQPQAGEGKKARAPSAYLVFCKQRREELKAAGVQASPQDVMKMLAAEWRARGAAESSSD